MIESAVASSGIIMDAHAPLMNGNLSTFALHYFPSSNKDLLDLLFILCKRAGIDEAGEVGNKRMRFADRVVLKHRHEENIFAFEQSRDVFQIG